MNRKVYCIFCGTDAEAVGYEENPQGEPVCDECIGSMTDDEYGLLVLGEEDSDASD